MNTTDGTPDAVKVACPVWSGGKGGDNFKALPITISREPIFAGSLLLCVVRDETCKAKLCIRAEAYGRSRGDREGKTFVIGCAYEVFGGKQSAWFQPSGCQAV